MTTFIRLTVKATGTTVAVNVDKIRAIYKGRDGCTIEYLEEDFMHVKESYEDIMKAFKVENIE